MNEVYSFDNLIGKSALYNERGAVFVCELESVNLLDSYQEFKLKIINVLNDAKLNIQSGDEFEVGMKAEYIDYEHNIITASYYMTWRLIFDEYIIGQVQAYKPTKEVSFARYLRKLIDDLYY